MPETYYFIGNPCKRGHSLRYVKGRGCVACHKIRSKMMSREHRKEIRTRFLARNPGYLDRYKGKYRRWDRRDPAKPCRWCGGVITRRFAIYYCTKECQRLSGNLLTRVRSRRPDQVQKIKLRNESYKKRKRQQIALRCAARHALRCDEPEYRASRREARRKIREKGKLALRALKELGITVDPLPGSEACPTSGRGLAARRALTELGIKL